MPSDRRAGRPHPRGHAPRYDPPGATDGQVWHAYVFAPEAFSGALCLPFPVAVDEVTAAFVHGLLTSTAPRVAAAKAQTIAIGGQAREPRPARATS